MNDMKRGVPEGDALSQALDALPTLGEVAKEEDFAPLRELLKPVAKRPVDQLGADLRGLLLKRGGQDHELLLGSFFGACDAAVRSAEERKRARIGEGDKAGEG
jgi:hypothetical protein